MTETLPTRFQEMRCRACQRSIKPNASLAASLGRRSTIASRDDCIYRCECGVAYSNARNEDERVLITASPELNVPREVRAGLVEALGQAANRGNRRNKLMKFCFETSEDAVSWTVFCGLAQQGRLDALVAPQRPPGEPALLIWGVPIGGARGPAIASALAEVCGSLGESASAYTEPDVIVAWADLLVLVEAKFQSGNERRPNYPRLRALPRPPRPVRGLARGGRGRRLLRADPQLAHRHGARREPRDTRLPAAQPRPAREDRGGRRPVRNARSPLAGARLRLLQLERHPGGGAADRALAGSLCLGAAPVVVLALRALFR